MASYTSVPNSGVAQGGRQLQQQQLQQQQQSGAEASFIGEGSAPRSEWWWGAGPVDSCCCCCPLPTGIVLLALNDILSGIWIIFLEAVEIRHLQAALLQAREVYTSSCKDYAASTAGCTELKASVEQAEDNIHVLLHLPLIYYVQGIICILAGVLGVSAVYLKSTRTAKVYMLSWPAKFLLGLWVTVDVVQSMKKYGVTQRGHIISLLIVKAFFLLYFFKVSWSYYIRLDHKNNRSSSSGGGGGGDDGGSAPSDIEGPAIAMVTVNSRA